VKSQKEIVSAYMDSFNEGNHAKILECLADDVRWDMPGYFRRTGKEEFDKEIENDAFEGRPSISVTRLVEEGNVVIAEGAVKCKIKNGGMLDAVFCDVFVFTGGRISHLTSYLMHRNQPIQGVPGADNPKK